MLSAGGPLLKHAGFDAFFDGQAESFLHGHWDVTADDISGEAFIVHGKTYGYFGFAPALWRIPLNLMFPDRRGSWTGLFLLLWIGVLVGSLLLFMDVFRIRSSPFLIVMAVLGSTTIFLCSHRLVYHEAILTGASLAVLGYLFLTVYFERPQLGFLVAGGMCGFLSFFSRVTTGAGVMVFATLIGMGLFFRRYGSRWPEGIARRGQAACEWFRFPSPEAAGRHALVVGMFLVATVAMYLTVNYEKFGTPLNPSPYQYQIQYDAARLARINGTMLHPENLPFTLSAYFHPARMTFRSSFPWFGLAHQGPAPGGITKMDLVEPYASIPAAMPALFLLCVLGIRFAVRQPAGIRRVGVLIAGAALVSGLLVSSFAYMSYRYLHDFTPFLMIPAVMGGAAIEAIRRPRLQRALRAVLLVAGVWSVAANLAFAFREQGESSWAMADRRAELLQVRRTMDGWIPIAGLEPLPFELGEEPPYAREGQLLLVKDPPATYRFDGVRWQYVSGTPLHAFHYGVRFPMAKLYQKMTLWSAGKAGARDAVYVEYMGPARVRFCFDHRGDGGECTSNVDIVPSHWYRLEIQAERLNSRLIVELDGKPVFQRAAAFYVWSDRDATAGRSAAPPSAGEPFTGEIQVGAPPEDDPAK